MGEKREKRTLSKEEIKDWNELYEYVKILLGYDKSQKLTTDMILRLKGLAEGTFMANKSLKQMADYPYKIIYLTFVFCKQKIMTAFKTKIFKSDYSKFSYMMKIVENNLNEVYNRYQLAKQSAKQFKNTDTSILTNEGADYVKKTKETKNENLKKYW